MREADMTAAEKSPQLTIVPAGPRELSHVTMLAHRIWPVAYAGVLKPEQIRNMLLTIYSPENLQKEVAEGHQFHVAYLDQLPVGYASAYIEDDVIWLKKLYVEPDMQGKRIGARLMHSAVSPLLPAREIRLLVNRGNVAAQTFYTKMGFTNVGQVPVKMGDFDFIDFIYSMPLNGK